MIIIIIIIIEAAAFNTDVEGIQSEVAQLVSIITIIRVAGWQSYYEDKYSFFFFSYDIIILILIV